ncbi:MAG: DEAD/DEAH box helicase [Gammaproteobacteria bacterium]|nr:DEAD/DEAH box helicase [Gammaproteobacteria bacterium]
MTDPYQLLAQPVQRWVHKQGWESLRPIQNAAIEPILNTDDDVILSASTASGKTEAAFLPILSRLISNTEEQESGCQVLYVAPLKALINDQLNRIELMTDGMNIPVTPWHGDISATRKKKFRDKPDGILLITPESIESLMVNHGPHISRIFHALSHVVIDELHSYIGDERGIQLQSLLHRIDIALRRRVPRVGLSATLGDMDIAASFMRPEKKRKVVLINSSDDAEELRIQVRGYESVAPSLEKLALPEEDEEVNEPVENDVFQIAQHLYKTLRGSHNLIFANSRRNVEHYADILRQMCEEHRVPIEFLPHHGSLSKEIREFAEEQIKKSSTPKNIICTSTLEMGIDIGDVGSIAQIESPFEVSAMRQRLGRSGRRGDPPTMRTYIREEELVPMSSVQARLREHTFQASAMTQLLLNKWCEPPLVKGLHLSTMIQQILSIIAQHGGATADQLWKVLTVDGPFSHVEQPVFVDLLKQMGEKQLLMQMTDGALHHGKVGEQIANHYSFYAAFNTPEEFTLLVGGKRIGRLPFDRPLAVHSYLIFAGKRWLVINVDPDKKIIDLKPAKGGNPPIFTGGGGLLHGEIRHEMYRLYCDSTEPTFLNKQSREFIKEGRDFFARNKLKDQWFLQDGKDVHLFFWEGDVIQDTVVALLAYHGVRAENGGIVVTAIETNKDRVINALEELVDYPPKSEEELSREIKNKWIGKFDNFLSDDLLNKSYGSHRFDIEDTLTSLKKKFS